MITHLEPDILECEVKWALESITTTKLVEVMEFQLNYFKAFDCADHNKLWKILREMGIQTTWPASWETCMQVRKQQLELNMEQQTVSK